MTWLYIIHELGEVLLSSYDKNDIAKEKSDCEQVTYPLSSELPAPSASTTVKTSSNIADDVVPTDIQRLPCQQGGNEDSRCKHRSTASTTSKTSKEVSKYSSPLTAVKDKSNNIEKVEDSIQSLSSKSEPRTRSCTCTK